MISDTNTANWISKAFSEAFKYDLTSKFGVEFWVIVYSHLFHISYHWKFKFLPVTALIVGEA